MNEKLKSFKTTDCTEKLNFDYNSIGRFGFIIPSKYQNEVIYLPDMIANDNSSIHHGSVLKFTLGKLFLDEKKKDFEKYKEINSEIDGCFMDSEEVAYSSFMASLNTVVFLNTSDEIFKSGILFIPDNKNLDEDKKRKINEIMDFLYAEKDVCSQIVMVPPLKDTLEKMDRIKTYDLDEFSNLNNNQKGRNNTI